MEIIKSKGSIYLIVTLILTALFVFIIHQFQLERNLYRYTVALPGVLGIVFLCSKKLTEINFKFFLKQFKVSGNVIKWLFLSLVVYFLLAYLASGISYLFFDGTFVLIPKFRIPLSKVWVIFVLAFFEEIGWRGVALPQLLKRFGLVKSSLAIGIIWAFWHFPGYLVGFGAPNDIPFIVFCIWVIASSFIFSWLYVKSNHNVWTAILLHFGANMALQLYPIMPQPAGTIATFYILTLLVILIAFLISKRHMENQDS